MDKPIRVLNVTTVFRAAGIESFIMNIYRNIDRTKLQFDFMIMRNEKEFYDDEINALGGNKHTISVKGSNTLTKILKESYELYKFLRMNSYSIIHIHYTTPLRAPYLLAAKLAGVDIRIYHSHSAEVSGKSKRKLIVYSFFKGKIDKWATHYFACSKVAAQWMFTRKNLLMGQDKVIYNGIDVNKFDFNERIRSRVRTELNLEGQYVIVHTGRFIDQKNHHFIIKVFAELKKKVSNSKLILIGTGDLLDEIVAMAKEIHLSEDVLFLGVRSDVECILCASDCYLMPSLYEGLPVSAVEAECSGLPCVFSDNITTEVALTDNVTFLSLSDPIEKWIDALISYKGLDRHGCSSIIKEKGYSIQDRAIELQNFYLKNGLLESCNTTT